MPASYRSNYAAANWKLNTLGVDGLRYRVTVSLPAVLRERKFAWRGGRKFTSAPMDEGRWRGWRSVRMTPGEVRSMRKESVKLLELFSKN